jgi:hypothetical protein
VDFMLRKELREATSAVLGLGKSTETVIGSTLARRIVLPGLVFAALAACAGPTLRVNVGYTPQGGEKLKVQVCRLAEKDWCAQDQPRIAMSVWSDCESTGDVRVEVLAPNESRMDKPVPVTLKQQETIPFSSPCFPMPKSRPARVTLRVTASCQGGKARETVECELR